MLTAGGILLVSGVFIARPYCRFLCPYGILLRWASLFSRWHGFAPVFGGSYLGGGDSAPYTSGNANPGSVRRDSPIKSPEESSVMVACLPDCETTVSLARPC